MKKAFASVPLALGLLIGACVMSITAEFPNRMVGADGQALVLDDLGEIASDPDLSTEEKRQAFRDLGIFDEELIDALLDL